MNVSEQLKELQAQKDLLTTQKEVLELKTQIAALSTALETPQAPAGDASAASAAEGEQEGSTAETGSTEEAAAPEEGGIDADSYLAEITAYEVLKDAAKKIAEQLPEIAQEERVLVLDEQCPISACLPLSDVVLHQTRKQIEIIKDQVDLQIEVLDSFLKQHDRVGLLGEEDVEPGEKRPEKQPTKPAKPFSEVLATFLSGWGAPVEAASALVKSVGDLMSQFATAFSFQPRDVTLPLGALVAATAGMIPGDHVHLLSMGSILSKPVASDSVLAKLDGLLTVIQMLDEKRIRVNAAVIIPLNIAVLTLTNAITKLEAQIEGLTTKIAAAEKRIGELKVKKQQEADPVKKKALQDEIDLEMPGLEQQQKQLTELKDELLNEKQALEAINDQLARVNAEVEVAAALIKTFTTFFQSLTTTSDQAKLSTLAQAVLREYLLDFDVLLRLGIHSSGAETITRKLFGFKAIRFVGGCVVSFTLARTDGEVVKSGLEVAAGQRRFSFGNPTETMLERIA